MKRESQEVRIIRVATGNSKHCFRKALGRVGPMTVIGNEVTAAAA